MTDHENLQIAAFERTAALLNQNQALMQGITKIAETKNALQTAIGAIRLITVEEEKGKGGAASISLLAKETLIQKTLTVQGPLVAYATVENDLALIEAADFSATQFKRALHEALYDKGKVVYDMALPHENVLKSDYGLPQTAMAQLNTALEAYKMALPDKGLAKNKQTANTKKRKAAFAQTTEIMQKLDKLMLVFRTTQPELYNSYLDASHIGLTNRRKKANGTQITGKVIDFETHQPISGAKLSILLQSTETFSGADGSFTLAVATPGEITLQSTKAGYTLWEDDMMIEEGESVTVLVEMEKGEGSEMRDER